MRAARAQLAQAEWRLDELSQAAPQAGRVIDTLYRQGEWVAAGAPVVSMLPPDNVKLRFFVPEPQLGAIEIGDQVQVRCDACPPGLLAEISFIAPEAEYTPPVIYSREMRAKLVFMVEARPTPARCAPPGPAGRRDPARADRLGRPMQPSAPAISVRGLAKVLGGRTVIEDFSIDVPAGHIFGFLGPNGSGKTTTIRMLCGLLTPDAGSGRCLGYDIIAQSAAIKREVGYMPQRFGLYEDLTIRENLDFVARLYGVPTSAAVEETLERLGLQERARQLAGQLSGGWKQRLALAACLLHAPRLLLLDEPTAGVDPKARREFWDQIHDLAARRHDGAGQHPLHGRGRALPSRSATSRAAGS